MLKYILLSVLFFSGLFGADTSYDQVLINDGWKDKAKVKLIDNNDTTYSLSTRVTGTLGEKINSFDGALNIHDPHSHHVIINEQFHQHTETTTTFDANATAGDVNITLVSATGFAVGNYLHLEDGVIEDNHPQITVLTGNIATLDRPLDNSFVVGDVITKTNQTMNVSGTLSSPQSFVINPPTDKVWHIEHIFLEMTHSSAGDNGLFGNISALANGFVIRVYDGSTGKFKTLSNWKTNSGMVLDGYDVSYAARSGGSGAYGTNAKGSIYENSGAVVRLSGANGDYIQVLVQDNLSTASSIRARVQGHIEGL